LINTRVEVDLNTRRRKVEAVSGRGVPTYRRRRPKRSPIRNSLLDMIFTPAPPPRLTLNKVFSRLQSFTLKNSVDFIATLMRALSA
jgi:hypothetical protein